MGQGRSGLAKAGGPRWTRRHSPWEPVPAVGGELASGEGWLGGGACGRERSPCSPDPPLRPPWGPRQVSRASLILTLPSAQNTSLILLLMNRFAWVSLRSISAAPEGPSTPFPYKEPDLWGSGPDLPLQVPGPGRAAAPWAPQPRLLQQTLPSIPSLDAVLRHGGTGCPQNTASTPRVRRPRPREPKGRGRGLGCLLSPRLSPAPGASGQPGPQGTGSSAPGTAGGQRL